MNLLQMSFSGAVFIIAVMLLRAFAVYKLPKKTFPVLWEMVFLKLLIPVSIPSVFSIYTLMNNHIAAPAFSQTEMSSFVPVIPQEQFFTQSGMESLSASTPSPVSVRLVVCSVVWCVGVIILTTFFAISWLRCQIAFQTAFPVRHAFIEQWIKEYSSKRPISIKQSAIISSPLTYGIFRPVILMPANTDWENENQLQYIFTHEYVHIRRFDAFTKLIAALVLCIHWFNPLVWIMYILFNRDIELACDESVVRHFGEKSKSAYSLMLINMEARKSGLLPFYSNFSKNAAEERITAIMRIKRMTPAAFILACLTVLVTAGMFATSAMAKADSNILSEKAEIATDHVIPYENADSSTEHVISHESTDNPTDYAATHEGSDVSTCHAIIHESVTILHYEDGAPYLHDILTNNTDKTIVETEYCMSAYDENGSPLELYWNFIDSSAKSSYENLVRTEGKILPHQTKDHRGGWSLYDGEIMDDMPKVGNGGANQVAYSLFCLKQVVFEDGTVWNNPEYENWFKTYVGKEIVVDTLESYYPYKYNLE